ncbi:hypothetical protein CBS101457_003127 [Exobasidium rhododendri]|nr:hypothetical protein CBS101457_003127 [Exobasidium rhododendri]
MSHREYPESRQYDDRDIYGPSVYDRGAVKRARSPSPYDRDEAYRAWAAKRARSREDYEASPAYGVGAASPLRGRNWDELDRDEKEREWARYEREQEWERYRAREYEAEAGDPYRDREASYRAEYDDRYRAYAEHDRAREPDTQRERWGAGPKAKPMDPMDLPSVVPFRKYAQMMRELGTEPSALATGPEATQELYDKYQEYRVAHSRKAMVPFFEAHKSDKWFVEKYGINEEEVQARLARRKKGRLGKKKAWLEELQGGKLDKVCWDAKDEAGSLVATTRLGDEERIDGGETVNIEAEPGQILVRQLPPEVSREEVERSIREAEEGYKYLALGEPHPSKKWSRIGWLQIETEDLPGVVERLNQMTFEGQKLTFEMATRPAQAKLKLAPQYSASIKRLFHDLQQAKDLTAALMKEDVDVLWKDDDEIDEALRVDASSEIEERCRELGLIKVDELEEESEAVRMSLKKSLDLHLDLLREVYNCDYYSSLLCDFPDELCRRSPKHLRRISGTREEPIGGEKSWASNLDGKHVLLMKPDDNKMGELGGRALDKLLMELAAPYSQEDGDEKHMCTVLVNEKECGKPFKAKLFVQKHVLNKHRDFIASISKEKVDETKYFNNYVRDPHRVMPSLPSVTNGRDGANGNGSANPLNARIGSFDAGGGGPGAAAADRNGNGGGYYGASGLIRMGGLINASGGQRSPVHNRRGGGGGGEDIGGTTSLGMRIGMGPVKTLKIEPLPSNPRPLDPRAAHAPKRYEDLDAGGGPESGEIELEY